MSIRLRVSLTHLMLIDATDKPLKVVYLAKSPYYYSCFSQLLLLSSHNHTLIIVGPSKYPSTIMPSTKPIYRARPVTSAPPTSPRTEDSQGYRRGRAIRSCLECRRRKMRCNRSRPCQNCNRFCRECVYLPFPEWPSGAPSNPQLEPNLQSPVQGDGRAYPSFDSHQRFGHVQPSTFTNHGAGYEPNTLAKQDRSCDTEADDDTLDVALQVGRLSITEKLGGYFRPHIATQVSILLSSRV